MDIKFDKKQLKAIANEFVREYQQQLSNFDANATGALSRTAKTDVEVKEIKDRVIKLSKKFKTTF